MKPPLNAEVVAEEERWQRALIMGEVGAKERRGWRRFLPAGRG